MKQINANFNELISSVPKDIKAELDLSFAISNRIYQLMAERGLTKKQFADAIGKRPSEITKWLSGQHNFTIRTLSQLSVFFGKNLITVGNGRKAAKPYVVNDIDGNAISWCAESETII
ncbi:MAG: helix-turn-helix transcriptional regulator [Bacteroidaceae bacterium]|nr:helix-turn-helix transcriptional regulator [Bacteroidaceae bacterium]